MSTEPPYLFNVNCLAFLSLLLCNFAALDLLGLLTRPAHVNHCMTDSQTLDLEGGGLTDETTIEEMSLKRSLDIVMHASGFKPDMQLEWQTQAPDFLAAVVYLYFAFNPNICQAIQPDMM